MSIPMDDPVVPVRHRFPAAPARPSTPRAPHPTSWPPDLQAYGAISPRPVQNATVRSFTKALRS